jgi:hypothetical protein
VPLSLGRSTHHSSFAPPRFLTMPRPTHQLLGPLEPFETREQLFLRILEEQGVKTSPTEGFGLKFDPHQIFRLSYSPALLTY